MARYDESKPYTPDYEDDCAACGEEFHRGELAWDGDELICSACEEHRYPEPMPTHLLK
jgi:formylmethanofuran dehydrogenase subunit E